MKSHQRKIRESRAESNSDADLFGNWWEGINPSISGAVVRECSYATASNIINTYEWLGCMPAVTWYTFGIYFDGYCGGVVCYGPEYSENLGIQAREHGRKCADWSKYGFEGKMILLNRGACTHWAHPHSASKLIRSSMAMLPPKFEVVTATVDPLAGEIGTIYQACGFHYVGSMRDGNDNVNSRPMDRDGWLVNGKLLGSRAMRAVCGSSKAEDIARVYPLAQKVKQSSKGRYFAFRGSRTAKKAHLASISHLVKPYPKRGKFQERNAGFHPEGVGQFDGSAPVTRF